MSHLASYLNYQALLTEVLAYMPKLVAAILILAGFRFLFTVTRPALVRIAEKVDLDQAVIKLFVDNIYKYTLLCFAVVMAAGQLGIDVAALLAGLGVAGIAIGFAAQDSLSNIIAGFIIFIDKPFKVGDWISVDGYYGKVWEITMRSTRIQTLNHTYVIIPNKNIIDAVLDNHSKYGQIRVEVPVGIAYKESIAEARSAILTALKDVQYVLEDPAPDVIAMELGDSSVNLIVRVWIDDGAHEKPVYYKTIEACKNALDAAGIQIPFPHLQLFVDDVEEKAVQKMAQLTGAEKR